MEGWRSHEIALIQAETNSHDPNKATQIQDLPRRHPEDEDEKRTVPFFPCHNYATYQGVKSLALTYFKKHRSVALPVLSRGLSWLLTVLRPPRRNGTGSAVSPRAQANRFGVGEPGTGSWRPPREGFIHGNIEITLKTRLNQTRV